MTPLCVDLDGTLSHSDLLYEGFLNALRNKPALILLMPVILILKGKAALKNFLAKNSSLKLEELRWNESVLKLIAERRAVGDEVYLTTAADKVIAENVASYHGFFNGVFSSDGVTNLKGHRKAEVLINRFGKEAFDYVGDHKVDAPIFRGARRGFLVGSNTLLNSFLAAGVTNLTLLDDRSLSLREAFKIWRKQLRVHQWAKNILLFAPILLAQLLLMREPLMNTFFGFIAFSLAASSVYLTNDLLDLPADRQHRTKRFRPLAAGLVSLRQALVTSFFLIVLALLLGSVVNLRFLLILLTYYIITLTYSLSLKRVALVDILTLASLYTIRILAGGATAEVILSPWLLAFSLSMFLSLGAVKRFVELFALPMQDPNEQILGRGYQRQDLELIRSLGVASGVSSVVILSLYVTSPEVTLLYHRPWLLLLACPLVLFWILRVWLLAGRNVLDEDPVLFAIHDRLSIIIGIFTLLVLFLATVI
jgi:4-hydroxybenzoate polyprenyltransferase